MQSERTREYVEAVLGLLMDPNAVFTFGQHEQMFAGEPMDRCLLADMAKYILEKVRGNTEPLELDFSFDARLMQTLNEDHTFMSEPQETRLTHYSAICRQALQNHKWPLSRVANCATVPPVHGSVRSSISKSHAGSPHQLETNVMRRHAKL